MRHVSVPAWLLAFLFVASLTSCEQTPPSQTVSPRAPVSQATHSLPRQPPTSGPGDSARRPTQCRANRLRLSVALSASTMSHPFADIAVTNTGTAPCVLSGYPRVKAGGHPGWPDSPASAMPMGIVVHHGIYERVDHGPHRVVVRPHHHVFFSIGTATAYGSAPHVVTLTRLTVNLPGTRAPKTLAISLLATRPPGRRFPVGVTAITAATHA